MTAKEQTSCGCYLGFFGWFVFFFWKSYFKVRQARFKRTGPAQGLFNSQERQSWQWELCSAQLQVPVLKSSFQAHTDVYPLPILQSLAYKEEDRKQGNGLCKFLWKYRNFLKLYKEIFIYIVRTNNISFFKKNLIITESRIFYDTLKLLFIYFKVLMSEVWALCSKFKSDTCSIIPVIKVPSEHASYSFQLLGNHHDNIFYRCGSGAYCSHKLLICFFSKLTIKTKYQPP